MTRQVALILYACIFLAACSSIEGTFEPACMALEGDRVVFAEGRFEWHKFTDERRLDDADKVVEPFPGYPLKGRFKVRNNVVEFFAEDGENPADMYLFETDSGVYLLTVEENTAAIAGEGLPVCPLRLNDTNSSN